MAFSIQFRVLNIWWDEVRYLSYQFNLSNLCDRPNAFRMQSFVSWTATDILLDSFYQYGTGTSKVLWGGWVHKPGCDRLNAFRMPPAPRYSYWHSLAGLLSIGYRHLEGPARWVGPWMHSGCHLPLGTATDISLGWLLSIWYRHLEGPMRWLSSLTRLRQTEYIPDATCP